jgi:inosose dehydratase
MANKTFDVKIGINPISWSNDDLPSLGGETPLSTALTEGRAIGYQGFELGNKFPRESAGATRADGRLRTRCRVGLVFRSARHSIR